jgi:hypothetical protein
LLIILLLGIQMVVLRTYEEFPERLLQIPVYGSIFLRGYYIMSVVSYGSNPKVCFTWNTANLNYVVISYSSIGNATVSSANLTSGTYTSPDLSLNSSYTFTMTPYNLLGITGTPKIFTVDTTAPTTYAAVGGGATSTSSAVKLQWYGSYSYVAISQSVNGGAYVDLSSVVVSTPYTVSDVSGNTALSYKITPYYSGVAGTAASVITVNTNVQAPRDVSAVYVDASGALISFTVPKNTYSSSAVYTLRATDASSGTYKDVSGTSSPIWIQDLSEGTTYSVVAKTTLDGSASLVSSSSTVSVTTSSGYSTYVSAIPIYTAAGTVSTFSGNSKTVSGATGTYAYANGSYDCSSSSYNLGDNGPWYPFYAANNGTATMWHTSYNGSGGFPTYTKGPYDTAGTYIGGGGTNNIYYWTTTVSGVSCAGEWLQYHLPYDLALTTYTIYSRVLAGRFPKIFWVAGSNDGSVWNLIDYKSNYVNDVSLSATFNITPSSYYSYFRFIFNATNGGSSAAVINLAQVNINGYLSTSTNVTNSSYLIVGGGGGGAAAGGGAGGVVYMPNVSLTKGAQYTITVGAAGTAGADQTAGGNGVASSISGTGLVATTITANGGAGAPKNNLVNGNTGGCGSGGSYTGGGTTTGGNSNQSAYTGHTVYGNSGGGNGGNIGSPYPSGGGGGAGGAGGSATLNTIAGSGGVGISNSITGTAIPYAGGGGGGLYATGGTAGSGGLGIGGNGSSGGNGTAGATNTGSGGGGGYTAGGAGGSGVVILSIPTSSYTGTHTGAPTVTTNGANTVLKFTASGTYTA